MPTGPGPGSGTGPVLSLGSIIGLLAAGVAAITVTALAISSTIDFTEVAAPAKSAAGKTRLYADSTSHDLKISRNAGAYGSVMAMFDTGASGTVPMSGTTTTDYLPGSANDSAAGFYINNLLGMWDGTNAQWKLDRASIGAFDVADTAGVDVYERTRSGGAPTAGNGKAGGSLTFTMGSGSDAFGGGGGNGGAGGSYTFTVGAGGAGDGGGSAGADGAFNVRGNLNATDIAGTGAGTIVTPGVTDLNLTPGGDVATTKHIKIDSDTSQLKLGDAQDVGLKHVAANTVAVTDGGTTDALRLTAGGRITGNAVGASTMSTVACATNVVTVVTTAAHNLATGQVVDVNAADNTYDKTNAIITVTNATTFTYPLTHGNEAEKADAGTVTPKPVLNLASAPTTADPLADVGIGTSATTQKALVLQGMSSQTANLLEAQDSTGTVRASMAAGTTPVVMGDLISGNGRIFSGKAGGTEVHTFGYFNGKAYYELLGPGPLVGLYAGAILNQRTYGFSLGATGELTWNATETSEGTRDLAIGRAAPGVLKVMNGTTTAPGGVIQSSSDTQTANTASVKLQSLSEEITIGTPGPTTDSTANLLSANSYVVGVVARVTTILPGGVTWSLGDDAGSPAKFAEALQPADAGTQTSTLYTGHVSPGGPAAQLLPFLQAAAAKVRVTTSGDPGAATGKIRVTVFYYTLTAPGS